MCAPADAFETGCTQYEYFQFRETPASLYEKDFHNLTPLTKGMHGYSLLRPEVNGAYFHELFDNCAAMGIPIEGASTSPAPSTRSRDTRLTGAL